MKVVVVAAGYATRLGELGQRKAKALLDVGGRPIIEHILDKVLECPELEEIVVVSNDKFYDQFEEWKANYVVDVPVNIVNDGSTCNEDRLGAIRDMAFAIKKRSIEGEVLMVAGDNILDFDFRSFYDEFRRNSSTTIPVLDVGDVNIVRRKNGVAEVVDGKVVSFEEKPEEPKSSMKSIFCYFFGAGIGLKIDEYLQAGNPDAPGHFMAWLVQREDVYAHQFEGRIYAIGTIEDYQEIDKLFREFKG